MQKTKTLSFKLVVLLLVACLIIPLLPEVTVKADNEEIYFAGFEDDVTTGWYKPWNGDFSITNEKSYWGDKSLKFTGRQNSWDSPAINLYNMIKQNGAGTYMVQMSVLVDDLADGGEYGHLLIRGNQENSFITLRSNGNYYYKLTSTVKFVENEWYHFTGSFVVKNSDISATSGLFNLCFDFITPTANQNIYIDNVRVVKMDPLQVIPTAETLYVGDSLILDVNRYNYTTYTSSDSSVATVDSNGVVLAIASGRTTITVNYNNIETAECVVVVKSVEDGQYFIKNVSADNYAQLDNNGDVIVEAWEFDGAQDQRWNITHVGAGYYKITCASGGNALTVADTENANKALEVANYTGASTQKWRVDELDNGVYKITPKVAIDSRIDWCMAVGDSVTEGITNGRNVEYRNYNNLNKQTKGQWEILLTELPTSGSELQYDENLWNYNPVQENTNCYAYILNQQTGLADSVSTFLQPGALYNYYNTNDETDVDISNYDTDHQQIVDAVCKDFQTYNTQKGTNKLFIPIERNAVCPKGTYKVALVIMPRQGLSSQRDFHWYRQNPDGTWSHKQGASKVTKNDESGNLIVDPYCADRGGYTLFVGYFAVSPWNNLYNSSARSITNDTNVVMTPEVNFEDIKTISVGMKYEQVVEKLGIEGINIGYGTVVHKYISDNKEVLIGYTIHPEGYFYVDYVSIGGENNENI